MKNRNLNPPPTSSLDPRLIRARTWLLEAGRYNMRAKEIRGRDREIAYQRKCQLIMSAVAADPKGEVIVVSDIRPARDGVSVVIGLSLLGDPWFGVHLPLAPNDTRLAVLLTLPRRGAA